MKESSVNGKIETKKVLSFSHALENYSLTQITRFQTYFDFLFPTLFFEEFVFSLARLLSSIILCEYVINYFRQFDIIHACAYIVYRSYKII